MDPERWRRIEYLYHLALEQGPGERSTLLAKICEGDEDLQRQVDVLLSQSGSTKGLVAGYGK